jgi:hypothetical protein
VAAAAVLSSAISASLDSVERQKRNLHASNLALSILAEIQMGARTPDAVGEMLFDPPFQDWTAQVTTGSTETEAGESSGLSRVEVVVRHKLSSTVFRAAQVMNLSHGGGVASPLPGAAQFP